MTKTPRLMLIDGNALIHRAFHAIPPLTTKSGELVNAVYGFTMILLKAIKDLEPDYCAVSFDLPAPTFRHEVYKEYKANRVKADQGLYDQIPRIKEMVQVLNLPIYEQAGFEADDIIGTLTTQATSKNIETVIVTGDLDTLQLVNGLSKVYTMRKGFSDTVIYDIAAVNDRYGLTPEQFIDYKSLRGDSSDNIPGIPGIGEKGATTLLQKYDTIEGILSHLEELPDRTRIALEENKDRLVLNKHLVTIVRDVPIELHLTPCMVEDYNREKAIRLFQELEFNSLLPKLPKSTAPAAKPTQTSNQMDLFATPSPHPSPLPQPSSLATNYQLPATLFSAHLITKKEDLQSLLSKLDQATNIVIDTEQDYLHGNLIGISLAIDDQEAYYIPMNHKNCGTIKCLELKYIIETLKPVLENEKIPKIGHNIKYDYTNLRKYGIILNPVHFDTMIASYILNPGSRSHSLDAASFVELGIEKIPLSSLIGDNKKGSVADAPLEQVGLYSAEDAHCTYRLWQKYAPEIEKHHFEKLFYDLEMPLVKILADMEITGIMIDVDYLANLQKTLRTRLGELEQGIYVDCGMTFNIASPKQLSDVLFNTLKLPTAEIKKGKTGGLSTAVDALEKLKGTHPVIAKIMQYRELAKLLNTYIETLPLMADPRGRIHTSFNQTITSTGRLSSSDPNLQNIPTKTELGQEIRRAFVARPGYQLVAADYSQIELRVMAHMAKDKNMINAFNDGRDIHAETSKSLNIDRRMAKVVNFSIIYGTSAYGLARALEIDIHTAKTLIDQYFATYSGVKQYMDDTVAFAKKEGYVETLFGRKRYIPEIYSTSPMVRNSAERAAINMPIQGSAADIMKLAMIDVDKYIKTEPNTEVLLQVHDELIIETPEGQVDQIAQNMKKIMESAAKLDVPLIVDIESGPNWADLTSKY